MASNLCATCGASVGEGVLLSESGEPICEKCNTHVELDQGEARASQAIFASSGSALAFATLAMLYNPWLLPTVGAVVSGASTMGLLIRHPEYRARLGIRTYIAGMLALLGMGLGFMAPVTGPLLRIAWFNRSTQPVAAPARSDEEPTDAPVDPARVVFESQIPEWIVALDARSAGREHPAPRDVASAHAAVLHAVDARWPSLHDAFERFLTDTETFSAGGDVTDADVTERLVLLDAALADARVPYYVDAMFVDHGERRRVLSSSYRIDRIRRFRTGANQLTSLDLTRIDRLSFEQSLLGYTRPEIRNALVLVSRVERFLIQHALPSIHSADESVTVRGYHHETDTEWVTPFENAVHEDLRREAMGLVAEHELSELAAAVVRRRVAIDALEHAVAGLTIRQPDSLEFDMDSLAGIARTAGPFVGEVRNAQTRIERVTAVFETLKAASLASIARHEAQHRLDYDADRLIAVPEALASYTGRTESEDRVNRLAERANAELSAYLSQVARDPERPLTTLVHILGFVMQRDAWGRPESYASLVLLASLADALGIEHDDLVRNRNVMRGEIARVYIVLRAHPRAEIASAAGRAWSALYGESLPQLIEQ